MYYRYISLFFLFIAFCFVGCKSRTAEKQAEKFLIGLDSVYIHVDVSGDQFESYYQYLGKVFVDGDRNALLSAQIDSVESLLNIYLNSLGQSRKAIAGVKEFDTAFQLTRYHTDYLEFQEKFWRKWAPQFIQLFELGWKGLSDQQKVSLAGSVELMKKGQLASQNLSQRISDETTRFAKKYRIKDKPKFSEK